MDDLLIESNTIRLLIIDDQPVIRLGIRTLLSQDPAITVVGDAACGQDIQGILAETRPNVVLLEPGPGDIRSSLESLQCAIPETDACRIVIYTTHDDKERIIEATLQRVNGYLTKDCSIDELLCAIHAVHQGGTTLSPNVAATLVQIFNEENYQAHPAQQMLSRRELEVLNCLAEGRSNRNIAKKLYICEATVKFHVHAILGKLNVRNRTEAVLAAAKRGFINLSHSQ